MKKLLFFVLFLIVFVKIINAFEATDSAQIIFFYGNGCPHCTKVENYFKKNQIYEKFNILSKEIYSNRDNAALYNQLLSDLGVGINDMGVPALIIGDQLIVGDSPIINYFSSQLSNPDSQTASNSALIENESKPKNLLTLPLVIGAAAVDAINPCAFAVLIILMTTILARKNSKTALKSGFAFSTSIFISYLLMGLSLYQAFNVPTISIIILKIAGTLAIFLGILNLKDYFWYGKGVLMEVPVSWRPKLKATINKASSPLGSFSVGFLVSLFLLPCTSGPYIVILGMLSQKTTQAAAFMYLILYNLIFILPMLIITLAVYKGLKPEKLEKIRQKNLKNLHLIAGLILLILGIVIL